MLEKSDATDNLLNVKDQRKSDVQSGRNDSTTVDRGWAWVVMFGAFTNLAVFLTFLRSASLLFILFLHKYKESATLTSMTLMFCSASFALCNIVGPTVLYRRFKVRTLAVTGAAINCLCIFIIAFAPNIFVIHVMMACMGFSHGLILVPQMTLVGCYFKKHLSFATAFVNLGLSIATIAGPPLTQFLLDTYGLQGAIIILAGINMNCIPASMLFRPVPQKKQLDLNTMQEGKPLNDKVENVNTELTVEKNEIQENWNERNDFKDREVTVTQSGEPTARTRGISDSDQGDVFGVMSDCVGTSYSDINAEISQDKEHITSSLIDKISLSSSIRYLSDINLYIVDSTSKEKSQVQSKNCTTEDMSANANTTEISRGMSTRRVSKESLQLTESKQTCLSKVQQSILQSIYLHPLAILLLLTYGFGIHTQVCIAYMPATGKENGLTNDQVPYLVTAIGISDLLAKIIVGVIADHSYIKRTHIACIGQVIAGTLLQFVTFFKGFGLMIVLQICLGMTLNIMHTLMAVVTVDILGLQHLGHIMAGSSLVSGIVTSLDHVVIGSLKDLTGYFVVGYNFVGSLILVSAVILLFEPLIAKYKLAKV